MCAYAVVCLWWLLAASLGGEWGVEASEFPDRECCDLPSPQPPTTTTPLTPASSGSPESIYTARPGSNTKTTIAILNCLLARQLCFEDASCSAILEIIPRVCGPELVACSTVTVTKCQAALRTLQAFPFFKPTCLCREPHVDPECNSFRDFLFDHPCVFVMKKEKDPYPVDALPTCNHALSVCQQEHKCIKLYEDFKSNCKVRDNRCRMDDRDLCYQSWSNLRKSPMFGCICPNNHMKKRCDRIFAMVNHNPCVDSTSTTISTSTGTSAPVADHVEGADDWLEELLIGAADWPTKDGAQKPAPSSESNSSSTFENDLGVTDALENPLVDAANGLEAHKGLDHISVTVLKNKSGAGNRWYPEDTDNTLDATAGTGAGIWTHHRHGQPATEGNEIQERQPIFHSTCHTAMASCQAHHKCRALMSPVLHYCDQQRCNRNGCMSALQAFYSKQDLIWNMEVAFCLCKKTDNKQDACLIAQEKLHPVCAQHTEDTPQPTCLHLAENCKENKECRLKLEHYEQSCSVDSVTKKCAGSPSECRNAILGILGTDLRTTCACKGTDLTQLYECLGWQRLLWVNPCVVEAQKNFHVSKSGYYKPTTTTTTELPRHTTEAQAPRPTSVQPIITVVAGTETPLQSKLNNSNQVHPVVEFIPPPQAFVPISTPSTTIASTTTTTTTTSTTRRTRATTTITTTIVPPRSCVVQRPQFPDQYIREGSFKRIYHEDEFECSDICECEVGEKLTCRTICIDRMPCKTEFAYYNHAAPAYQAYRGRCLCYSGRFICMKPMPNDYNLPQGIYLFLGYSEVDERELNRNHTVVIVQDVVRVLQNIMEDEAVNGTLCNLEFFNATKENVIIAGKLSDAMEYTRLSPAEVLQREKDECMDLLEIISEKINSRNPDFISHLLLSIFKMAEVEIVQPEPTSGASTHFSKVFLLITMALLTGLSQLNTDACIS